MTDLRLNIQNTELPPGMLSSDDLMTDQGVWVPVGDAIPFLEMLRDQILHRNERFGLFSNRQAEVLAELDEVLAFIRSQLPHAEKFNFSAVM